MKHPMIEKIINGLRTFFAKRYSLAVASDYLEKGQVLHTSDGWTFLLPDTGRQYHFDKNLNFINLTDV